MNQLILAFAIVLLINYISNTSIYATAQSASQSCQDVVILPYELTVSQARDVETNLIDIHLFQKFFTYQISKDGQQPVTNVITTRFDPSKAHWRLHESNSLQPAGDDLLLRLRTSFMSSRMDFSDQSMIVSVIEEQTGKVIVDGSSEVMDERNVHLDSIDISSAKSYILKYEFFQKNLVQASFQDKTVSGGHMGALTCSQPFVV